MSDPIRYKIKRIPVRGYQRDHQGDACPAAVAAERPGAWLKGLCGMGRRHLHGALKKRMAEAAFLRPERTSAISLPEDKASAYIETVERDVVGRTVATDVEDGSG